eukprot:2902723-Pyramimonas_sp.AAC.1
MVWHAQALAPVQDRALKATLKDQSRALRHLAAAALEVRGPPTSVQHGIASLAALGLRCRAVRDEVDAQ